MTTTVINEIIPFTATTGTKRELVFFQWNLIKRVRIEVGENAR